MKRLLKVQIYAKIKNSHIREKGILRKIAKGEYFLTVHAQQRMSER
jgi:hypothetical protein